MLLLEGVQPSKNHHYTPKGKSAVAIKFHPSTSNCVKQVGADIINMNLTMS